MKNKLKVNVDHFVDEEAKMAYVQLRIDGEASEHIQPRLEDDSADLYKNHTEILTHLQSIYEDLNRLFNSKNDFKRLYMKPSQTFYEFYTQFLHLSSKAQIVLSKLKYELY
jgi:archaellum component FlaC